MPLYRLQEGLGLGMEEGLSSQVVWKKSNWKVYEPPVRLHEQYGDTTASKRNEGS